MMQQLNRTTEISSVVHTMVRRRMITPEQEGEIIDAIEKSWNI